MSRVREQTYMSIFTLLSAVGSDVSILRAPMAAAISPFVSTTKRSTERNARNLIMKSFSTEHGDKHGLSDQ